MKKPHYRKMPKPLKRYWKNQDQEIFVYAMSKGILIGGLIMAIAWLLSL